MSAQSVSACPLHRLRVDGPAGHVGGTAALLYGVVAYGAFFGVFLYAMGFVGNWFVPKSIDSGTPGAVVPSLLINGVLLALFVVQHTVMARPAFKAWWTRIVPRSVERSTFVLLASACLALAFWQWRPLPQTVWRVPGPTDGWGWYALTAVSLTGYAIVLASSFMLSHFDLFGLRQVWARFRGRAPAPIPFRLTGFYRVVRHPLMVGFLIAFWATPHMTVGHLFFAVMTTAYIFMGTWFEERDLIAAHGEDYRAYKRRVRGLVPVPRWGGGSAAPTTKHAA